MRFVKIVGGGLGGLCVEKWMQGVLHLGRPASCLLTSMRVHPLAWSSHLQGNRSIGRDQEHELLSSMIFSIWHSIDPTLAWFSDIRRLRGRTRQKSYFL